MALETKIKQTFLQKIRNGLTNKLMILATAGTLAFSACGEVDNGSECSSDYDYKGDRICVEGSCVNDGNSYNNDNNNNNNNNNPECISHYLRVCEGGDSYWEDSCGYLEGMVEKCNYDESCQNGYCVGEEVECKSFDHRSCCENSENVCWVDSCGNVGDMVQNCVSQYKVCEDAECVNDVDGTHESYCQPCNDNGDCEGKWQCDKGSFFVTDDYDYFCAPIIQVCSHDDECSGNYSCIDIGPGNRCLPFEIVCKDGDLWYDSVCGSQKMKFKNCPNGCYYKECN